MWPLTRVPGPAAPPREAEERVRPESGSAGGAGALRALVSPASPRVQVHSRVGARGVGSEVSPRQTLVGSYRTRGSQDPTPPPSRPRRAADRGAWADGHPVCSPPPPLPGPTARQPPSPTWRLRLEKKLDFLSAPLRVQSGIGRKSFDHAACAFAVSSRFAEEKPLPPQSRFPLPPKAPYRFVKKGARSEKFVI